MTTQQWIALGIFVLSYGLIISEKVSRTIASIFGAVLAFHLHFIPTGSPPLRELGDHPLCLRDDDGDRDDERVRVSSDG